MKKISIVTVDFNSHKETHDCLDSLEKLDIFDISLGIVVVDNASKEPFVPTKEERKEHIHFIKNEVNLGFSGGYNTGIKFALDSGADYVMLLNNDTIVDRDLIQ